ncbi:MAG: ribosome maturation factor RimP [Balneolaceae bacterium]
MSESQEKIIAKLAEPIAAQYDMYVVDVEIKQHNGIVVWINVDSESDVANVDKCSQISREIGFLLDAHNVIQNSYRLNVSTPGLSRPLSDIRQYKKNRGRIARVKYTSDGTYITVDGILSEVTESEIEVKPEEKDKEPIKIGFDKVVETKILPKI